MIAIEYDGHYVYATLPNYDPPRLQKCEVMLLEMAALIANFASNRGILLGKESAEIRDNDDKSITVRYTIEAM